MKKKLVFIWLLIFITQCLHPHANKSSRNKSIKKRSQQLSRSISVGSLGVDANVTAFAGPSQFYIGTNANADKSLTRVYMTRGDDGNLALGFQGMAPNTENVTINTEPDQNSPLNAKNISNLVIGVDVNKNKCPVVGLLDGEEDGAEEYPSQGVFIFQVIDTIQGTFILTNSDINNLIEFPLNDTTQTEAKGIHALAATQSPEENTTDPMIFALVSDKATLNEATIGKIGVVPTSVYSDYLNPLDAANFGNSEENNKAVPILPALTIPTNSSNTPIFMSNAIADMCWDDTLQTLYIAFSNLQTNTNNNVGAAGLLIGNITSKSIGDVTSYSLQIQKCANIPDTGITSWPAGVSNWIVGYLNSSTPKAQTINLYKVRVMHTSTGKDYVILNGEVAQTIDSTMCSVYALPVMPNNPNLPDNNANAGKLAMANNLDGTFSVITDGSELLIDKDIQAIVGVGPQYLVHATTAKAFIDATITDMQISGDTVYVSVAGDRGEGGSNTAGEAGIFASTAIFASNGVIRAWTPWQRVMGFTNKAYGFGFDTGSNNFWYVGPDKQTSQMTLWSSGDTSSTGIHAGSPLYTALQPYFSSNALGVVNLSNFDDQTPGFKSWNPTSLYPAFSMMVASGLGNVAIIQTGDRASTNKSAFEPTAAFVPTLVQSTTPTSTGTPNVFVFNNSTTQNLGFITTAEVSRIQTSVSNAKQNIYQTGGWLFIGGSNGVAVLCQSNGSGWNTSSGLAGLSNADFPVNGYAFNQLIPPTTTPAYNFSNILKLVSDGEYLYILTPSDLYRLEMNANDFAINAIINPRRINRIAGVDGAFKNTSGVQVMNKNLDSFFDLIVIDGAINAKKLAIATTQGVWVSNAIADNFALKNINWNKNISKTGGQERFLGPSLSFDFLSVQRGGGTTDSTGNNLVDGNLYVTAIDYRFSNLVVCRFNVQNGVVKMFNEPYISGGGFGTFVPYFYKLATLGSIFRGIQFGVLDHVGRNGQISESIGVTPDPSDFLPTSFASNPYYYAAIDLGMDPQAALHLFSIVQDTASGALYIPGEFNVFVNE